MTERESQQESHIVPQLIHFIWIGDVIPEKYILNIQSFSMNTDYQIYLWTDKNTSNALKDPEGFVLQDIYR